MNSEALARCHKWLGHNLPSPADFIHESVSWSVAIDQFEVLRHRHRISEGHERAPDRCLHITIHNVTRTDPAYRGGELLRPMFCRQCTLQTCSERQRAAGRDDDVAW